MRTPKGVTEAALNPSRTVESWSQICAGLGAAAWATLAVLAKVGVVPIGAIELMFLFAPLVIVPLGLELGRLMGASDPITAVARKFQPAAAAFAIITLCLPPGKLAGVFAFGWMIICALVGFSAVKDFFSASKSNLRRFALNIARIDLVVGGSWFVASRLGMRPMGIQEPIGLLTAVHFHFAGFATAMIASAALMFSEQRNTTRWLKPIVPLVVVMPFAVAAGFVTSPVLKMIAVVVFSLSIASLAINVRSLGRQARSSTARVLLQIAPACVFAGMVLAAAYAVADFRGSDVLPIPQMARTHGVLNAVGFCMCGLLGWLIEFSASGD